MSQRRAVTKTIATRYKRADKAAKGAILDELCATTGWHRNHARKALGQALKPKIVRARKARTPRYGEDVVAALAFCWAVLGAPTGKRLAPIMAELVPTLRRFGELAITDDLQAALIAMSPATMDRRLAADRAKMTLRGRSHTKPGSLLKSQIPIRRWAQWDEAVPGFVEIDLVGTRGRQRGRRPLLHVDGHRHRDRVDGEPQLRNKARRWVIAALADIATVMPFPINWAIVRTVVGYHRYDTPAELRLLNRIWVLQSLMTNFFYPQQKLISKVRDGARITKRYDPATTPHCRAIGHDDVGIEDKAILTDTYTDLNPAAIQRDIQALTAQLLNLTTSKAHPAMKPSAQTSHTRASANESTTPATRAS